MRHVPVLLALISSVTSTPNLFADFLLPSPEESTANNSTLDSSNLDLLKRQSNACATGYGSCANLGNPGLCCRLDTICSADAVGNIACCPSRAACTGTIGGINTASIPRVSTSLDPFQTTTTQPFGVPTTTNFVPFPTTSTDFIQSGGPLPTTAPRSMVPNSFYPFPYIPTTYTNAAACSAAYTACQTDAMSCSNALASGVQGVTVSAPNGGATVTAIQSLGPQVAQSVCLSLSLAACSGLQVSACQVYGTGMPGAGNKGRAACGGLYGVGAGVVMGVVGQMGLVR